MPYCPECGTEVKRGIKFCPECGTRIAHPAAPVSAGGKRVEKFNRERIKTEITDARLKYYACGIVVAILGLFTLAYTFVALQVLGTQRMLDANTYGLLPMMWLAVIVLCYAEWRFRRRYIEWKSLL